MKALIIGGAGFVGGYLTEYLIRTGARVFVTKISGDRFDGKADGVFDVDLLDKASLQRALRESRPNVIFHLAAQSSVALSWKEPALTVDVNIKGCLNVLDTVRDEGGNPKIILVGSGDEYGKGGNTGEPIGEVMAAEPMNVYAATKACQGMVGRIYSEAYGMDIVMTRSFNHTGPKQSPLFVVSDFCRQIALIEKGVNPAVMKVGNLSAKRDFTDVRDVVKAYALLAEKGRRGEVYNVGSGNAIAIDDILKTALSLSKVKITVETDPAKLRPVDVPIIEADISKIKNDTGWQPVISIEQTVSDTLSYWREQL